MYFSEQLLTKLFHICDSSLAAEGVDVSQAHTTSQIGIQAPLTVDGDPLLFSLQVGRLGFNRKRLQPYADGATKAELLSRPLPSIYPLGRLLSIHQTNVYRMEHRFRQYFIGNKRIKNHYKALGKPNFIDNYILFDSSATWSFGALWRIDHGCYQL